MKHLQGLHCHQSTMEFFRKEQGWRRGQKTLRPTIVASTNDYTSPEKTAKTQSCLLHANNEETTPTRRASSAYRKFKFAFLHQSAGKARIFIQQNTWGNKVIFFFIQNRQLCTWTILTCFISSKICLI